MIEQRSCTAYLPAGRDPEQHAKAVHGAAMLMAMEYGLAGLNVVPLTVEGTTRQGWLVVFKGETRRLEKLPASEPELAALVERRVEAEWRYQFLHLDDDELTEDDLVRLTADYPEVDWLR